MLGLASLLCIVFVAEARCYVLSELLPTRPEWPTPLSSLAGHKILEEYRSMMLDRAYFLQVIWFGRDYEWPPLFSYGGTEPNSSLTLTQPPSDECYAFMKSYLNMNPKRLARCTASWFEEASQSYFLMEEIFKNAENRWANVAAAAENGGTWYDAKFVNNSQDTVCFGRTDYKLAEIIAEAIEDSNRHLEILIKVVHTGILAAGKCMCRNKACLKWAEVCHESIGLVNNLDFERALRISSPSTSTAALISRYESLLKKEKEQKTEETMLAKKDNS